MDAQNRTQGSAQQAARSAEEQAQDTSNGTWRKFAEPRGWALKWDGFALAGVGEPQNGRVPSSKVKPR